MTVEERLQRITGWTCSRDGLAFETANQAEHHVSREGCRWGLEYTHAKTLAELQVQMDAALKRLADQETAMHHARSRISEAWAAHRTTRLARNAAKERAEAAQRLWAERAGDAAKQILTAGAT